MEQKHRSEFPEKELWDLTAHTKTVRISCVQSRKRERISINLNLITRAIFILLRISRRPLRNWNKFYIQMSHIGNYGFMPQTTDYSNEDFANIAQAGMEFETDASVALTFLTTPWWQQTRRSWTVWVNCLI